MAHKNPLCQFCDEKPAKVLSIRALGTDRPPFRRPVYCSKDCATADALRVSWADNKFWCNACEEWLPFDKEDDLNVCPNIDLHEALK